MRAFSASASARCPARISSPSCRLPALRSARRSLASASSSRRRASAASRRSIALGRLALARDRALHRVGIVADELERDHAVSVSGVGGGPEPLDDEVGGRAMRAASRRAGRSAGPGTTGTAPRTCRPAGSPALTGPRRRSPPGAPRPSHVSVPGSRAARPLSARRWSASSPAAAGGSASLRTSIRARSGAYASSQARAARGAFLEQVPLGIGERLRPSRPPSVRRCRRRAPGAAGRGARTGVGRPRPPRRQVGVGVHQGGGEDAVVVGRQVALHLDARRWPRRSGPTRRRGAGWHRSRRDRTRWRGWGAGERSAGAAARRGPPRRSRARPPRDPCCCSSSGRRCSGTRTAG